MHRCSSQCRMQNDPGGGSSSSIRSNRNPESEESTFVQSRLCLSRLRVHSATKIIAHVKDHMSSCRQEKGLRQSLSRFWPKGRWHGNIQITLKSNRIIQIWIVNTNGGRTTVAIRIIVHSALIRAAVRMAASSVVESKVIQPCP